MHSTCVTLTEKLLEKEDPLVTAERTADWVEERPTSTYTGKGGKEGSVTFDTV